MTLGGGAGTWQQGMVALLPLAFIKSRSRAILLRGVNGLHAQDGAYSHFPRSLT